MEKKQQQQLIVRSGSTIKFLKFADLIENYIPPSGQNTIWSGFDMSNVVKEEEDKPVLLWQYAQASGELVEITQDV